MTCIVCGGPCAPAEHGWPLYYVGGVNSGPVTWGGRVMVMCGPRCFTEWRRKNRHASWDTD